MLIKHDMKTRTITFIAAVMLMGGHSAIVSAQDLQGSPAQTNVPEADYPRVLPDGRAMFMLKAPGQTKSRLTYAAGNIL